MGSEVASEVLVPMLTSTAARAVSIEATLLGATAVSSGLVCGMLATAGMTAVSIKEDCEVRTVSKELLEASTGGQSVSVTVVLSVTVIVDRR